MRESGHDMLGNAIPVCMETPKKKKKKKKR
jgi:hypothetical protein